MRLMGLPSCTTKDHSKDPWSDPPISEAWGWEVQRTRQLEKVGTWNVPWGARARGSRRGTPRMDQKARARTVERAQPYRRWGRSSLGRGRETDMGRVTSARDDSFLTGALPNGMPL